MIDADKNNRRFLQSVRVWVVVITLLVVSFEFLKEAIAPGLSKWQSLLTSLVFLGLLGAMVGARFSEVLSGQARDTARLRGENAARRAAEEKFHGIFESAADAAILADHEGRIALVNARTEELFGYARWELLGEPIEILLPEHFRDRHPTLRANYVRSPHVRAMGASDDLWARNKDGVTFPVEIALSPMEVDGQTMVYASVRDVTERKRTQQELSTRLRFEQLTSRLSAAFVNLPAERSERRLDAELERLAGFFGVDRCAIHEISEDETQHHITHTWTAAGTDLDPDFSEGRLNERLPWLTHRVASGEGVVFASADELPQECVQEREYMQRLGARSAAIVPLRVGANAIGALEMDAIREQRSWPGEDLRRLQLVAEIIASAVLGRRFEEALENLSARVIRAQEDERRRIARDLHDDVNQRLCLLAIDLDLLGANPPAGADEIHRRSRELADQARELSLGVHEVSHELYPANLEHLGLVAPLGSLCATVAEKFEIEVPFAQRGIPREISPEISLCLYRITQEALQNVVKHSRSREARVEISREGDEIHLHISDSGVGFDPQSLRSAAGIGLAGIRERLRPLGGSVSIDSAPSRGTRIAVRVPAGLGSAAAPDVS
jgi:PAS domain S-box-containing protein